MNESMGSLAPVPTQGGESFPAASAPGQQHGVQSLRPSGLRQLAALVTRQWLPMLEWSVRRTGRPGLVGIALLVATGVFYCSTYVSTVHDVQALREQLSVATANVAPHPTAVVTDSASELVRTLPARTAVPELLGQLLAQAEAAQVTLDTGKYEVTTTKAGAIARYSMSFPVTGTYPQVRTFIDNVLKAMPAVAITELAIERKHIGDSAVEAQLRLTLFTRSAS